MKYVNQNKLSKIKLNKDNFYVLIDFDRTLTRGNSISCWRVLYYSNLLGDDFKEKYDYIHDKSLPSKNESKEIKQNAYTQRFKEYMDLLGESKLNDDIIKQSVHKTDLQLRDGANEFLKKMYEMNIPVVIISCSIGNVLIEYLKYNNCYYDNMYVYANYYDVKGKCTYNITPYNKNEISFSRELQDKIDNRKYILLLGDLIEDINMISQDKVDNTITVGFLDKRIEEDLPKYKNSFDIVLTSNMGFNDLDLINYKDE